MRVLIYGDSNSFGTAPMATLSEHPVHPKGARWGDVLAKALGADCTLHGLPGRTTVFDDPVEGAHLNGLTVLPAILGSHWPVDLFVMCLGTNDFKTRFGLRAADVGMGAGRVLQAAAASGHVTRMLCVIPPRPRPAGAMAALFHDAFARSEGLSGWMTRCAKSAGAAVFDAGAVIAPDPLDGIHWSLDSHAALGQAVARDIRGRA